VESEQYPVHLLYEQEAVIVETRENINVQTIKIFQDSKDSSYYLQGETFLIPLSKLTVVLKLSEESYTFVHQTVFTTLKFIKQDMNVFTCIITQLTTIRQVPKQSSYGTIVTEKVVKGLETTTGYVTTGISITSDVFSHGIKKTGEVIKKQMTGQENVKVHPSIKKGFEITEKVVSTTAQVTTGMIGVILDGISYVTAGTIVAVHDSIPKSSTGENFENVKKICVQGAKGVVNVVGSATEGVMSVIKDTGETTHGVLDYKYGRDVADVGKSGFNIVKGGVETVICVASVNPKGIILGTMQRTTGTLVKQVVKRSEKEVNDKMDEICERVICVEDGIVQENVEPNMEEKVVQIDSKVENQVEVSENVVNQVPDVDIEWIHVDAERDRGDNQ